MYTLNVNNLTQLSKYYYNFFYFRLLLKYLISILEHLILTQCYEDKIQISFFSSISWMLVPSKKQNVIKIVSTRKWGNWDFEVYFIFYSVVIQILEMDVLKITCYINIHPKCKNTNSPVIYGLYVIEKLEFSKSVISTGRN